MAEAKRPAGINYMISALLAAAGIGIEIIYALLIEPVFYGEQMQNWTNSQIILHWIITCISWGTVIILLIRNSKNKYGFDLLEKKEKMKIPQLAGVFICILFSLYTSYLSWEGFKIIREFQSNGLTKFIFQYIYYAFETGLFTLIIIFGQKAFEMWFRKEKIPFGGIVAALTWGLGHIFTKSDLMTGLYSALSGFMFGSVYLLVNKDFKKTLYVLYIMFII